MIGLRRALLVTSVDRYLALAINFAVVALVSRMLTPAEVGLAVLGTSLLVVAEALRDFGAGNYLIQHREAGRESVRTAFTVMAGIACLIVVPLLAFAGPLAAAYGEERLGPFLQVTALGFLAGPVSAPILALLRREMAFGALAAVNVLSTLVGAATSVGLVALGLGFMSFAWGGFACSVSAAALALWVRPDLSIFRFRLVEWRSALAFGGYSSATAILNRLHEVLPHLVLGRMQSPGNVGLYSRALLVCQLPDKALLSVTFSVTLPAFAAEAREGRDLKRPYLRALSYISVLQWPVLISVALLAHPVVEILLGPQWLSIVPLVQIMAAAQLFAFPASLTYPLLVAVGAIRDTLTTSLISLPLSAAVLIGAAAISIEAAALSLLITVPLQVLIALVFVRRRIPFEWSELAGAVWKSAVVAACTAAAPSAIVLHQGARLEPLSWAALAAGAGAALGWAAGVRLVRHPFSDEIRRAGSRVLHSASYSLARRPSRRLHAHAKTDQVA